MISAVFLFFYDMRIPTCGVILRVNEKLLQIPFFSCIALHCIAWDFNS